MSQAQQSNAITRFRGSVESVGRIVPEGLAHIDRLVDLGILIEVGDGSLLAGTAVEGAFNGENDHLTASSLAAAATVLRQAAGLVASPINRPILSAIPR